MNPTSATRVVKLYTLAKQTGAVEASYLQATLENIKVRTLHVTLLLPPWKTNHRIGPHATHAFLELATEKTIIPAHSQERKGTWYEDISDKIAATAT
jgi:hypothetical protein